VKKGEALREETYQMLEEIAMKAIDNGRLSLRALSFEKLKGRDLSP
jgi:hypothetical protein